MNGSLWYADTSAIFKLVAQEPESAPFRTWAFDKGRLATCDLTRVEARRAARLARPDALPRLEELFEALDFIRLDDAIYEMAASLDPPSLRSLDAIHLAAALRLGDDLAGIVTYDARMTRGARGLGIPVESPGAQV